MTRKPRMVCNRAGWNPLEQIRAMRAPLLDRRHLWGHNCFFTFGFRLRLLADGATLCDGHRIGWRSADSLEPSWAEVRKEKKKEKMPC